MGLSLQAPWLKRSLAVLMLWPTTAALAVERGSATSGWSTEAKPGTGKTSGNPALCKSFEKSIADRIEVMRTLRFGGKKPPPLLPQDLREWHLNTHVDPNASQRYASEEAMVKRLNGYMADNGCTPVDVDAELLKGPVEAKRR